MSVDRIKVYKLRIFLFLLFIAVLLTYLGMKYKKISTESDSWKSDFPKKIIDTPYFTITREEGWVGGLSESFDEEAKPLLVRFHAYDAHHNNPNDYQEIASIFFLFNRHNTEEDWLSFKHSKIIFDIGAQKVKDELFGEYFRYEGYTNISLGNKGEPLYRESESPYVYIAFQQKPGLWVIFWGFQEHEHAFWNMINSIQWKKKI